MRLPFPLSFSDEIPGRRPRKRPVSRLREKGRWGRGVLSTLVGSGDEVRHEKVRPTDMRRTVAPRHPRRRECSDVYTWTRKHFWLWVKDGIGVRERCPLFTVLPCVGTVSFLEPRRTDKHRCASIRPNISSYVRTHRHTNTLIDVQT